MVCTAGLVWQLVGVGLYMALYSPPAHITFSSIALVVHLSVCLWAPPCFVVDGEGGELFIPAASKK